MKTFGQLHQETRAVHLDFLRVEIATALTLMDIAVTTMNPETRARNLKKASEAHASVIRSAAKVMLTAEETEELQAKLLLLESRLGSLKCPQPPNP